MFVVVRSTLFGAGVCLEGLLKRACLGLWGCPGVQKPFAECVKPFIQKMPDVAMASQGHIGRFRKQKVISSWYST